MCYILCMCVCVCVGVWACQIRQLRLTIPTSSALCVVCVRRFPGGSQGGQGWPPLVTRNKKKIGAVFAILADFAIFSNFLN
jgi:hypothetical protein